MIDNDKPEPSLRKYMVRMYTHTYNWITIGMLGALLFDKIKIETFLAYLIGYVGIVNMITNAYFERSDRKKEGGTQ